MFRLKGENMYRRFNCCIFNHPCPIFCPINLACRGGNEIVNPIITSDFGFFNNLSVGEIASQGIIPVGFVQGSGAGILPSTITSGAVTLSAGTYEISYSVSGTVPASGTISAKLQVNGVDVSGSTISTTQTAGNAVNLSRTIVITVPQTSTLQIVNNSSDATTYTNASLLIKNI